MKLLNTYVVFSITYKRINDFTFFIKISQFFFIRDLSFAFQRLMLNSANLWPINGLLLGFFSVCLEWATVAAVIAGLWRLISRREALIARIGRFIQQQPVLGVLALVLLNVGIGTVLGLVWRMIEPPPNYSAEKYYRWNDNSHQFLYNVVFVLLLFWLARQRLRSQETRGSDAVVQY